MSRDDVYSAVVFGLACFYFGCLYGFYRRVKQPLMLAWWAEKVVSLQRALEAVEVRGAGVGAEGAGGDAAGGPRVAGSAASPAALCDQRESA